MVGKWRYLGVGKLSLSLKIILVISQCVYNINHLLYSFGFKTCLSNYKIMIGSAVAQW